MTIISFAALHLTAKTKGAIKSHMPKTRIFL
jgi:hypothetical protein